MADYNSSLPIRTEAAGDAIVKLCDKTTNTQQLAIDANGLAAVKASGADSGGTARVLRTDANGQLLVVPSVGVSGGEVHDYELKNILAAGTWDFDYTVTALKTLLFQQVIVGASGKVRVDIMAGPVGTLVPIASLYNSTAQPNVELKLAKPFEVVAGDIVRITVTNRDNQPQDVYTTIVGEEV